MPLIKPAVSTAWEPWNIRFEGLIHWMYVDTLGLVTTAMGDLIDTIVDAQALPWQHADGTPASAAEIAAEWTRVKNNVAYRRGGAQAARVAATLFLSDDAIEQLVEGALERAAAILVQHPAFADFANWPADAQIALLSMAWAMGPGFGPNWPRFSAFCAARDFVSAAANCNMQDAGGGIAARNAATADALNLAAKVVQLGLDPNILLSDYPALAA